MIYPMMYTEVATKRSPAVVGGQRSSPATYLTSVPCTPLMPVSSEIAQRFPDKTPRELLQCFVGGDYDVKEGDILVVDSREYPIKEAAEWRLRRDSLIHLILEDLKAA